MNNQQSASPVLRLALRVLVYGCVFSLLALCVLSSFIKPLGPLMPMEYSSLSMSLIPIAVFINAWFAEKAPMNTTQEATPTLYRVLQVLLVGSVLVLFLLSIFVPALRLLRAISYFLGAICWLGVGLFLHSAFAEIFGIHDGPTLRRVGTRRARFILLAEGGIWCCMGAIVVDSVLT
jgi:hypothetical protein